MDLYAEFEWRGLVYEATEGLREALAAGPLVGYIGFDPTAPSLHVGSLLPLTVLARFQRAGHRPIAIVGGGTGLIGDPSGKLQERPLLRAEEVRRHLEGLRAQIARFLDLERGARILDNAEWLAPLDLMSFLREIGKHFTVNYLLQKESVRRRLEQADGLSFTEFSYVLLQAYDFLVLYDRFGCTLQMGGSDQWGNITAGIDLIRKLRGARAHGLVLPLVTTAAGTKFGKTEAGTVWLDPQLTSPFRFYQFWLNTDDRDVVRYLKYFSFRSREELDELAATVEREPERRVAQRELAKELTVRVHGLEAAVRAERASEVLFGGDLRGVAVEDVLAVFEDAPSTELAMPPEGLGLVDLLVTTGLAPSRSEAVRLIRGGGVYLNNRRIGDERARVGPEEALGGQVLLLRKGARQVHVVKLSR
ncbi:MAG TPA: tyrosine--tRNA ligase [Vicinamibacterales bacterium]|nr:tyrosine--tRNA ligase [Vicinamibacterales bacterium]